MSLIVGRRVRDKQPGGPIVSLNTWNPIARFVSFAWTGSTPGYGFGCGPMAAVGTRKEDVGGNGFLPGAATGYASGTHYFQRSSSLTPWTGILLVDDTTLLKQWGLLSFSNSSGAGYGLRTVDTGAGAVVVRVVNNGTGEQVTGSAGVNTLPVNVYVFGYTGSARVAYINGVSYSLSSTDFPGSGASNVVRVGDGWGSTPGASGCGAIIFGAAICANVWIGANAAIWLSSDPINFWSLFNPFNYMNWMQTAGAAPSIIGPLVAPYHLTGGGPLVSGRLVI